MLHDDTLAAQDSPFDIEIGEDDDDDDQDEDDENDDGEEDEEGGWQVGHGPAPA